MKVSEGFGWEQCERSVKGWGDKAREMSKGPECKPRMLDLGTGALSPDPTELPWASHGNEWEEAVNPGLRVEEMINGRLLNNPQIQGGATK